MVTTHPLAQCENHRDGSSKLKRRRRGEGTGVKYKGKAGRRKLIKLIVT